MTENFPNLKKETNIQLQKEQRISNKINPKRPTPRDIIIETSKVKRQGETLKSRKNKISCNTQGNPHKTLS